MGIKIRINGKWMEIAGVTKPPQWGDIQGSLAAQADLMAVLDAKVPVARKVAGKPLSADVTLGPEDVDAIPVRGGTLSGYLPDKLTSQVRNIRMVPDKPADSEGMDGDIFVTPGPAQPFVVQDPFGITIDGVKLQEATADKYGVMTCDQVKALAGLVQTDAKVAALEASQAQQDTKLDTLKRDAMMLGEEQTVKGPKHMGWYHTFPDEAPDTMISVKSLMRFIDRVIPPYTSMPEADIPSFSIVSRQAFANKMFEATTLSSDSICIIGSLAFYKSNIVKIVLNAPNILMSGLAFFRAASMTTFDMMSTDRIEQGVFSNSGITALVIRADHVVQLSNTNAFTGCPINTGSGYIYVPDSLVDQYKQATNWITYASQIKPLSALPPEVAA